MEKKKSLSWIISNAFWVILMYVAPTRFYLSLKYRVIFGKWIDWHNPQAFTEKLQWLKVYGFKPEYVKMVDKVLVKMYVTEKIGKEYIIPTLTVADSADGLDRGALPSKFVLKTNHDSGTALLCKDKFSFDFDAAKRMLNKALKSNYYLMGRESPYKYVKRKVFAEAFLEHDDDLVDYKFFCFNGEPKVLKIDYDRETRHHANYYDADMHLLPFYKKSSRPDNPKEFIKPANYDRMIGIARTLSKNIPFVRIDLYNLNGKIYFGEITFFPSSGFEPLTDPDWDYKLGSWITLPNKNSNA